MTEIPPHFHKTDRLLETDIIPDSQIYDSLPERAEEGRFAILRNGSVFELHRYVDGSWRMLGREASQGGSLHLPAGQAITAGSIVKIASGSGQAVAVPVIGIQASANGYSVQALSGTPSASGSVKEVLGLSPTTIVLFGEVGNTLGQSWQFYVAGTVSGKTVSWGSAEYITLGGTSNFPVRLVRVDDTHFVILTESFNGASSLIPAAYVVSVSGNSVSRGTVDNLGYSFSGSNIFDPFDAVLVSTNKVLFLLNDSPDSDINAKVATVDTSAKTFTVGTEYQVSSSTLTRPRVHLLGTDRVLFTSHASSTYQVATISGTTISSVANNTFSFTPQRFRFMKGSTNEGLAAWYNGTNCVIAKMTEASGTCTFTMTQTLSAGSTTGLIDELNSLEVYDIEKGVWLVHTNPSSGSGARLATLTPSVILLGDAITIHTTAGYSFGAVPSVTGGKAVATMVIGNAASPYFTFAFDYQEAIGVSNNTVSAGADTGISILGDTTTALSGLSPGFTYYVDGSGNLSVVSSAQVNGSTYTGKKLGSALSSAEMLIMAI